MDSNGMVMPKDSINIETAKMLLWLSHGDRRVSIGNDILRRGHMELITNAHDGGDRGPWHMYHIVWKAANGKEFSWATSDIDRAAQYVKVMWDSNLA